VARVEEDLLFQHHAQDELQYALNLQTFEQASQRELPELSSNTRHKPHQPPISNQPPPHTWKLEIGAREERVRR
jgi:hypothetical protein